jgi:hypothetical protein
MPVQRHTTDTRQQERNTPMHGTTTINHPRPRGRRALLAALLPAALAAAMLPAAAQASTAGIQNDGTLSYRGSSDETNTLTVREFSDRVEVHDLRGVKATRPFNSFAQLCVPVNAQTLRCPRRPVDIRRIAAALNDRDDTAIINASLPTIVDGGSGDDRYIAGSSPFASRVEFRGGEHFDAALYTSSGVGVRLSGDGVANDGRVGLDQENIARDVEQLTGSSFADELTGVTNAGSIFVAQDLRGGAGNDVLRAGAAQTQFQMGAVADGADQLIGGPGRSFVIYGDRTRPVKATLNFGGADDGEAGEGDEITGSNENANGGQAGDVLRAPPGSTATHRLSGEGGSDRIEGAEGNDELLGGDGGDTLLGGGGDDLLRTRDAFADTVGCGSGTDTAELDSRDGFDSCENRPVGVLRLTPKALRVETGKVARLRLSWRHPRGWRQLRKVELRLYSGHDHVGTVAIRPSGKRIAADGAVKLAERTSRISREGKTVSAQLALRLDRSLAGRRLRLEVEAVDAGGARQVERRAGSIRIAG